MKHARVPSSATRKVGSQMPWPHESEGRPEVWVQLERNCQVWPPSALRKTSIFWAE